MNGEDHCIVLSSDWNTLSAYITNILYELNIMSLKEYLITRENPPMHGMSRFFLVMVCNIDSLQYKYIQGLKLFIFIIFLLIYRYVS